MALRNRPLLALAIGLLTVGVSLGQTDETLLNQSLQGRLDALAQQVDLRYRFHEPTLAEKRGQIKSVLAEWNAAQSAGYQQTGDGENQARMAAWLDLALRSAMPGGSGKLPEAPEFIEVLATQPAPSLVSESQPEIAAERSDASLFDEVDLVAQPIENPPTKAQPPIVDRHQRREVAKPVTEPMTELTAEPTTGPMRGRTRPESAPTRSKWSRHPAAAPLEWRDPFAADPSASHNPLRSGTRYESRRPVFRSYRGARVNRRQLEAEIRGYNQTLRDLQVSVMNLDAGDIFGLADAAEQLERLEQQRQFLDLYREGMSSEEQSRLPDSPSSELVRELVRRKARELASQSPPKHREERRALEQLNNRLAGLDGGTASNR